MVGSLRYLLYNKLANGQSLVDHLHDFSSNWQLQLSHGIAFGQRPIAGLRHSHNWVLHMRTLCIYARENSENHEQRPHIQRNVTL